MLFVLICFPSLNVKHAQVELIATSLNGTKCLKHVEDKIFKW